MSEITVKPGRPGLCVLVPFNGRECPLMLTFPDDTYARIDLVYAKPGEVGIIPGTPMPPPLQAPECPDGAEVLAGVLVKPVYVASSDIIEPDKLQA